MDQLVQNRNIGLALIVLLVAVLIVRIIRRMVRPRKIVADALAEGIKKSKEPQPGGAARP